ncbi:helix-turn-helix domain-containing protein [Croceicoccus sp. F390]|uniref:Helix-turn-helix domain-containing protein n=1 Tax=Croceicoccus esteveae TaxID=3075597 RepID=A0ABU2ZJD0_9SPHN|nr:helix-turn-helix domain-containing protein [Croceicoccus sp. F390]MDT0576495.1 helix-turn-helix domain-containing protein [Croceicoccus sp. F390]
MSKVIDLENEYLTSNEVSGWLKVSRRTLHRWARLRKGPPSIKVGRSVYYRRASVEQWLVSLENAAEPVATVARFRP